MNNGHLHRMFIVVFAVCAVVIVASLIATAWYTAHITNDRRAEQVAGCERANLQRAAINQIIVELRLDVKPLVIPVCEDIIG